MNWYPLKLLPLSFDTIQFVIARPNLRCDMAIIARSMVTISSTRQVFVFLAMTTSFTAIILRTAILPFKSAMAEQKWPMALHSLHTTGLTGLLWLLIRW